MSDRCDHSAIQGVIDRYFFAIDRLDQALLRTCFADDAHYTSDAGTLNMVSGEEIGNRLGRGGRYAHTSHIRGSQHIAIQGDTATADTFAVAYLVSSASAGGIILVRGLQYTDKLARGASGWAIVRRHHSTKWQYQQTSVEMMRV